MPSRWSRLLTVHIYGSVFLKSTQRHTHTTPGPIPGGPTATPTKIWSAGSNLSSTAATALRHHLGLCKSTLCWSACDGGLHCIAFVDLSMRELGLCRQHVKKHRKHRHAGYRLCDFAGVRHSVIAHMIPSMFRLAHLFVCVCCVVVLGDTYIKNIMYIYIHIYIYIHTYLNIYIYILIYSMHTPLPLSFQLIDSFRVIVCRLFS